MKPETEEIKVDKNSILTEELIKQAEQLYRMGLRDRTVSGYLGVHPDVFISWLKRGRHYGSGLYGELFNRCMRAVTGNEIQFVQKLLEHSLGSPKKLAYKKNPDGTDSHEVLRDAEGNPIVLQEEIKSNSNDLKWFLERRHPIWNKVERFDFSQSTIENPINDAQPTEDKGLALPVPMTKEEQIEMFLRAMKRVKDE